MLSEAGRGWIVSGVGCGWVKRVKVYLTGSGQVVNKDGYGE